jgi:hypothetical protein
VGGFPDLRQLPGIVVPYLDVAIGKICCVRLLKTVLLLELRKTKLSFVFRLFQVGKEVFISRL